MRRPEHTVTAVEVQQLSSQLLSPLLGTWPTAVRKCTLHAVLALLTYAASRITSLSDASARLAHAPDSDTVLAHLSCQLVDTDTLDRRLRGVLAASLPRALRRGVWDIAMDLTLIAYHGQPLADATEIYRGEPKSGTTHFHAYATAFVIRDGRRFTLAIVPVTGGTPSHEVVRQLRRRIVAAGVKIKRLLLDRGFNNAGTIRYLQSARQPFIMPQAIHGRAPRSGQLTGLRAIRATHATGWTTYSWKPKNEHRVSVDVCVVRRRRRDRGGNRAFLYACWGVRSTPATVRRVYRLRFGIETSYRQMNQCRVRTTTRNPAIRLLFVAVALLLRNLWAWLHWVVVSSRGRGGRRVQLERLRLRTMVLWLLHRAEQAFSISDQTHADHPPDEPLVARQRLLP
jgi:hypothetical protein